MRTLLCVSLCILAPLPYPRWLVGASLPLPLFAIQFYFWFGGGPRSRVCCCFSLVSLSPFSEASCPRACVCFFRCSSCLSYTIVICCCGVLRIINLFFMFGGGDVLVGGTPCVPLSVSSAGRYEAELSSTRASLDEANNQIALVSGPRCRCFARYSIWSQFLSCFIFCVVADARMLRFLSAFVCVCVFFFLALSLLVFVEFCSFYPGSCSVRHLWS